MMLVLSLSCVLMVVMDVVGAGQVNTQALNMYKQQFNGDATYYGDSGGAGACGYGIPDPPVSTRTKMAVALNNPQFMGSVMCGSCWRVQASGQGLGNNPVTGTFTVFVNDLCPECHQGSVDLGVSGDGRWKVNVQAVQCPVGNDKVEFKFQGSNPWYVKLQVRNSRIPVHVMEIDSNGWHRMTHSQDGYFLYSGGPLHGQIRVRLTAINGAQIIETIPSIQNGKIFPGTHQFPLDSSLAH